MWNNWYTMEFIFLGIQIIALVYLILGDKYDWDGIEIAGFISQFGCIPIIFCWLVGMAVNNT